MRDVFSWLITLAVSVVIGFMIITNYNRHENIIEGDYSKYFTHIEEDIIVLSVSWCQYCKELKELLKDNNVKYYDFDPTLQSNKASIYQELNLDVFPVIVTKDKKINGYAKHFIQGLEEFENASK